MNVLWWEGGRRGQCLEREPARIKLRGRWSGEFGRGFYSFPSGFSDREEPQNAVEGQNAVDVVDFVIS